MKRYIEIDALRGLMIILMTIRHYEGAFSNYGINIFSFITEAEVFVFLSGLIAGLLYTEKQNYSPAKVAVNYSRIIKIYSYHVTNIAIVASLFILFSFLDLINPSSYEAYGLDSLTSTPIESLSLSLVFLYMPRYLDILPLFFMSSLVVPISLSFFSNRKALQVLGLSFLLWLIPQASPLIFQHENPFINLKEAPFYEGYFNLLSWQFLFVISAYIGFSFQEIQRFYSSSKIFVIAFLLCCMFAIFKITTYLYKDIELPEILESKPHLGLLRITNLLSLSLVTYWVIKNKFIPFKKFTFISSLGKYSLEVFTFHVIIVYLSILIRDYFDYSILSGVQKIGVDIITLPILILCLSIPVFLKQKRHA